MSVNPWELLHETRLVALKACAHGSIPYAQWSRDQHEADRVVRRITAALNAYDAKAEWVPDRSSRRTQGEVWDNGTFLLSVCLYRPKNRPPVWRWHAETDVSLGDGEAPTIEKAKEFAMVAMRQADAR